ncbi:hypothetical protein GQR58_009431 [Nymphon striatum]|nr:hypothetical protein GQR58_009431 [Nymphon striatum]
MCPTWTNVWVRDMGNYRYPVEKIGECPTQYGKKDPRHYQQYPTNINAHEQNQFYDRKGKPYWDEHENPGKENIWCKYYLLRQYSSSSSAGEYSTLMTTDDGTMYSSSTSNNDGVVLLQLQVWMGNTLPPTEWGCRSHDGTLAPVKTDMPVAPESLLNMVSCGCKPDGCSNMTCSCNKLGLFCTSMCSKCSGQTCNNTTPSLLDVDNEDIALDISVEDSPADDEDEY